MNDVVRLVDIPNYSDALVYDNMELLNSFISQNAQEPGAYEYYPDELIGFVDVYELEKAWGSQIYPNVRRILVEGWMKYSESFSAEPPYFTLEEFLDGTVHEFFNA